MPETEQRYALEGRIVTMNDQFDVLDRGVVYVQGQRIAAVVPLGAPPPEGFEETTPVATGGTIYPGLIDLHNHLAYNVLPLWQTPRLFQNRGEWAGDEDYLRRVSKAMLVLALHPELLGPIARYTEAKCLLAGVTTTQGMRFKKKTLEKHFKGLIRNVEQPDAGSDLPAARTRVPDVSAGQVDDFLQALRDSHCVLLHLCEGVDPDTRRHFEVLQLADGEWAITEALAGIHAVCLSADDFRVLHERGAAVIWSPLSNMLLYGQTMDVEAARDSGILMGIGSDWSPSGSKNLLGELKAARLVSQERGGVFSDRELLAMATRNAAQILKWQGHVGVLQEGALADLLVLNGRRGDPYDAFLRSRESTITLVVVDGIPRCGQKRLMSRFGPGTETWRVGTTERVLNLSQGDGDLLVEDLTLREASDRLDKAIRNLPQLAANLNESPSAALARVMADAEDQWFLVLDMEETAPGRTSDVSPVEALFEAAPEERMDLFLAAIPRPEEVLAGELDRATVVGDRSYWRRLEAQPNLPPSIIEGLAELY